MGGASRLRDAVEVAGGRLEVSIRELRDSFGITRLTAAGRERIARELGAKGLRLEPPMPRLALDERVTIVAPRPRPVSIAVASEPVPDATPGPEAAPRRPFWSNRRRAVMAGAGIGLLVVLLAAVFAGNVGKHAPDAASIESPPPTASPPAPASTPAATQLIASLRTADAAAAEDDTDAARRILRSIDAEVATADAELASQFRIISNRVRLTESYLGAVALAESGRYREARETMLGLVPFRDAGVRARLYGVELAKDLVTQARAQVPSSPDRALALLDEAEDIAPSLSVITEARAEAAGG